MGLLIGIFVYFTGFFNGIYECIPRQNKKKYKKLDNPEKIKGIIALLFLFAVESALLVAVGASNAITQNQFKIIKNDDETYCAVIYENSDSYVITDCVIDDNTIVFTDLDTKRKIDSNGIEYTIKHVTKIKEGQK